MKRSHSHSDETYVRPASLQSSGLGLFDDATRGVCDSPRIPAPSVPVASSERGAEKIAPKLKGQNARILITLRAAGCVPGSGKYLSREEIEARCDLTVNAASGRLAPSGRLLVPKGQQPACPWTVLAKEDAVTSSAGLLVTGYQLTSYGVECAGGLARRDEEAAA